MGSRTSSDWRSTLEQRKNYFSRSKGYLRYNGLVEGHNSSTQNKNIYLTYSSRCRIFIIGFLLTFSSWFWIWMRSCNTTLWHASHQWKLCCCSPIVSHKEEEDTAVAEVWEPGGPENFLKQKFCWLERCNVAVGTSHPGIRLI